MEEVWHLASAQPEIRDSALKSMLNDNENCIELSENDEWDIDQTEEIKNGAEASDVEMHDA
jgi:hypothetical protein